MEEVALEDAGHHLEGLGAARAHQAEHARDLSGEDRQRVVLDHRRHAQVLDGEHALARRTHLLLASGIQRLGQVAPDHGLDDARPVEVLRLVSDDMAAIAQHGDAVADQKRLFERVRNEDDGDAAPLELAHQVEEIFLLLGRQAGGRLVEDDDLGVVQHGARDLDHLLLGGAELGHGGRRRHVEIERLQELLGGDVDATQAIVELLLTEEEVLRHRHRWHQAVLLEHHGDAEFLRLHGRAQRDLAAADQHLAGAERDHAGHHLGEGRFAGAILADQGVDLAGRQAEVDRVDRR
jgi:hypothetical protein